ncbi:carbohydrate ABC transporter permease [Paenibacillus arenilitoris]|uniref:Sugar ABC transporter permease n=1 Tax=Paenibacillus arenilitoris TaxID=2772299 RepID=A0A927CS24_9BACL|nr:sugar ABC transporter permease [Paenibacillus arenilitoris]MBD2870580.1 sugar ABC transporter permease [Paenibacillus arenilitoris]
MNGVNAKKPSSRLSYLRSEERYAYAFIFPALASLLVFVFYPMLQALIVSFKDFNLISPDSEFVGLSNYIELLKDRDFLDSLLHSFHFAVVVIPVQTAIALGLALLIKRKTWYAPLFRTVYFLPVVIAIGVASTVFRLLYNNDFGLLNTILNAVGLPKIAFLSDPQAAIYGVMLLGIWKSVGFFMIIFLAGLNNISPDIYEAAQMDGASPWDSFWRITLPLLNRTTAFVVIITTIDAIKISGPIFILTGGGPAGSTTTATFFIVEKAFEEMQMGYSTAAAFILFVIVLAISLVQMKFFKTDVEH